MTVWNLGTAVKSHAILRKQIPKREMTIGKNESPVPLVTPERISIEMYVSQNGARNLSILIPSSITSASFVKSEKQSLPVSVKMIEAATVKAAVIARDSHMHFLSLVYFPAPKFCPANVVTEIPIALTIVQNAASILENAAHDAIVTVPNEFMAD